MTNYLDELRELRRLAEELKDLINPRFRYEWFHEKLNEYEIDVELRSKFQHSTSRYLNTTIADLLSKFFLRENPFLDKWNCSLKFINERDYGSKRELSGEWIYTHPEVNEDVKFKFDIEIPLFEAKKPEPYSYGFWLTLMQCYECGTLHTENSRIEEEKEVKCPSCDVRRLHKVAEEETALHWSGDWDL